MFRPSRTVAFCALILLSACATADDRLQDAAVLTGWSEAGKILPDYPEDCRKSERSGVRTGEPLDVALLRTDQALGRANARVRRCAAWYDTHRSGYAGKRHE